jgi:hypothetical protein
MEGTRAVQISVLHQLAHRYKLKICALAVHWVGIIKGRLRDRLCRLGENLPSLLEL